jgi:hypothetical protein
MPTATATVATERPARYIKQLVSHMGRKVGGSVGDDGVGVFTTVSGAVVTLTPEQGALVLRVDADDPQVVTAATESVARHLTRFATQEELQVSWAEHQ